MRNSLMAKNTIFAAFLLGVAFFATLAPVQTATAMTAEQYFEDGNRLFRDDLYWAALLRYRQAADDGLDSALLHYNSGIAHYRAGQHMRSRESLQRALQDPTLRVATQYNLGLNAYAAGDTQEALRWFRIVRDQGENEKLQTFAVVAIARIRAAQAKPDEFDSRLADREQKRAFADLELRARVSFGSDDNVFRSPDQPYVDFSDPAQPLVTPVPKSGVFMPLRLSAKYKINSLPFEGFYAAYRLAGRYYQDKDLENANEYLHEASFGSEYSRTEGTRKREVNSAFTVAQHDEVYYDPDDGGNRIFGGLNIDDRMNYLRYGPQLSLRQAYERLAIGARFKGQLWNYEKTGVVPEYDHEYFLVNAFGQYRFTKTSLFRVTAEYYSRRFGDRPAYDLDGQQRIGNPTIRYDYLSLGLRARQRITDSMWFGWDVERTERTDQYVGYNDYTRDSFRFDFHWAPGARFDLELRAIYRLYDYPNALAFHNAFTGPKTQEAADASIVGTFRLTEHLSLVGEASYRETVSNDTRIQYERYQYLLGVRWNR
ncbi:MAG: tetratricopeptide repeat protein [Gammaproteobacteria bacterium]|nr:tetratricopeptide repeat protein [Gammaproteobacteria bacterium]NNL50154.1 tetratricopeptide repeat protein [Woeseiaceae bacterium]